MATNSTPSTGFEIFISYSHKDEPMRAKLEPYLEALKRTTRLIYAWHDRKITAGEEWRGKIDQHLESAHIILLLISADFLASDYCTDIEMKRALERHKAGEARAIPVLLRPVVWTGHAISELQALPRGGRPVSLWQRRDHAYHDIADGIREAIEEMFSPELEELPPPPTEGTASQSEATTTPGGTGNAREDPIDPPPPPIAIDPPLKNDPPVDGLEQLAVYPDSSQETFVQYLKRYDSLWIIGITNEHLVEHLGRAFSHRRGRRWSEVKIIFQARHLVNHFGDGQQDRVEHWQKGVTETVKFFLESEERTDKLDMRYANRILPFVGQFYNHTHVRVAFALPIPDLRTSHYINYASKPADTSSLASDDIDLLYREHYKALKYAFENLRNASTPLLTANVIGRQGKDGTLQFESLVPQNNWRRYEELLNVKPMHLVTFIILHTESHYLLLQFRAENNSNNQLGKYGVLSGYVNDEDFPAENPPEYWRTIYKLQMAFDAIKDSDNDELKVAANEARRRATHVFSMASGIKAGETIPEETLHFACKRAASRYLDEKLGLDDVTMDRLRLFDKSYVVEKPEYSLYAKLMSLKLTDAEVQLTQDRRPFANMKKIGLIKLDSLRTSNELTKFLAENYDEVVEFLKTEGIRP